MLPTTTTRRTTSLCAWSRIHLLLEFWLFFLYIFICIRDHFYKAGCVFLSAAGYYDPDSGDSSYAGTDGGYWSSTQDNDIGLIAYIVRFYNSYFDASGGLYTSYYFAVRLVHE